MAVPADRNDQQRQEEDAEDEHRNQSSKSGETQGDKKPAQQQQQWRPRRRRSVSWPLARDQSPPAPPLRLVSAKAMRATWLGVLLLGRAVMDLPLGRRIVLVADKARSCTMQALRFLLPSHLTAQHTDSVEIRPSPAGLSLVQAVKMLLRRVENYLATTPLTIYAQLPGIQHMLDRVNCYRRELLDLLPGRPHSVEVPPEGAKTTEPVPSILRFEEPRSTEAVAPRSTEAVAPRSTEAVAPRSTEAVAPRSSAIEQSKVIPSKSSSSSSSSASSGSITEEVLKPYYSPPHFVEGFKDRRGRRHKKRGKDVKEGEREDDETQGDDDDEQQEAAAAAEERGFIFGPQPSSSSSSSEEPPSTQGGRRRSARRPATSLFLSLFGLKMA